MATKLEFLVAKEKMLVALATVSVAISSPDHASELYELLLIPDEHTGLFSSPAYPYPVYRPIQNPMFIEVQP